MANGQVGTAWVDVKPKVDGNPEAVGKEIGSGILKDATNSSIDKGYEELSKMLIL